MCHVFSDVGAPDDGSSLGDAVGNNSHTDAGTRRDGNRSIGTNHDLGIDQVRREISPAGGHIARQREPGERRQMNIVRAADATFQHAAVPDRRAVRGRNVVHSNRLRVPADAARLDVDDPARAHGQRSSARRGVSRDSSRQIGVRSRACSPHDRECRRNRAAARSS